jgi:hypothetical protein
LTEAAASLQQPSALYEHCLRVYGTMEKEAVHETIVLEDGTKLEVLMWTGALTKVFGRLELSTPYYTHVMDHLKRMDCVEQYRRGGGSTPSKWVLHREPTPDLFENAEYHRPTSNKVRMDIIEQRIRDLNKKIDVLARAAHVTF